MVYVIEVAKFGQWIGISSIWNCQTVVLNCRAIVLRECMSSPGGDCRSILYGVMKIRKLVVIVWKCKMGGCEHPYLAMIWSAPIHLKIGSNKPPKRGNGWFSEPICIRSSTEGLSPPVMMNWMHADLQIEVEKRHLIDDWKTAVWNAQESIFQAQSSRLFYQSQVESHKLPLKEWLVISFECTYICAQAKHFFPHFLLLNSTLWNWTQNFPK